MAHWLAFYMMLNSISSVFMFNHFCNVFEKKLGFIDLKDEFTASMSCLCVMNNTCIAFQKMSLSKT